jgi:glycosyltransferase involved in cell wall biosynthesis
MAGSLAQLPCRGGHTWVFLQYLLGFRELGFDVLFIDRLSAAMDQRRGVHYMKSVMSRFGLDDNYCVLGEDQTVLGGADRDEALRRTSESIGLININGFLDDEEFLAAAPRRVYLDIDPGFAQMWHELGLHDSFAGHDDFVTLAERIGRPGCRIPTCGLEWKTTRPPVVLDLWPTAGGGGESFTSVGSWRGPFAAIEFDGTSFGLRAHEFRKFFELPRLTGESFEVALEIDGREISDLSQLERCGWRIRDPRVVAASPDDYQAYVRTSRAELMVAKNMYVETRGGWFSDRSACYLASGRPVVAEDTGLAGLYPLGDGLVPFNTVDEAVAAVEAVSADYARHARAAREIAESELGSDGVLQALVERALG